MKSSAQKVLGLVFALGLLLQSCGFHRDKETAASVPYGDLEPEVALGPNYVSIRRNIFIKKRCFSCHAPEGKAHDTPLEPLSALLQSPKDLILARNPEESGLLLSLINPNEKKRMPPPKFGPRLSADEIELIRKWIELGAPERE